MNIKDEINGPKGYCIIRMTDEELKQYREMIRRQWLYRIQLACPEVAHHFFDIEIDQYHTISDKLDHNKIWSKYTRVFLPWDIELIKSMSFMDRLRKDFGDLSFHMNTDLKREDMYWRLVRPGNQDIGPLHADEWFFDVGNVTMPEGSTATKVKLWISLYTNSNKNGLRVVPGSHKKIDEYKFNKVIRDGAPKPDFDEHSYDLDILHLETTPGDVVVFNYSLLHGGIPGSDQTTRVSSEITVLTD